MTTKIDAHWQARADYDDVAPPGERIESWDLPARWEGERHRSIVPQWVTADWHFDTDDTKWTLRSLTIGGPLRTNIGKRHASKTAKLMFTSDRPWSGEVAIATAPPWLREWADKHAPETVKA